MSSYAYPNPQAIFYQQYEAVRRDEVVGILLALFLGTFRRPPFLSAPHGAGHSLSAAFAGRGFRRFLGFIECFFMPGRVREFNAIQAAGIAAALGIPVPVWGQPVNATVNTPPGQLPLRRHSPRHSTHARTATKPTRPAHISARAAEETL